jgi:hypothetical protein
MAKKALQLAKAAAQSGKTKVDWSESPAAHVESMREIVKYLDDIVKARTLLDHNRAAEAVALLNETCPPHHSGNTIFLLKAEAAYRNGNPQKAYDDLAALVADRADPQLNSELLKYAAKLDKTPQQVEAEIWKVRDSHAQQFKDFELTTYDGKKVKLSDYRGKVVLLTFWFPH